MPTFEIVLGNETPEAAAPSAEWLEQWRNFEPV
jgi:zinc transport system substrate-binding protein